MPAASSNISVDIVASFGAFKEALDQAAEATKSFSEKVKSNLESLASPFEQLHGLIVGLATGLVFKEIVDGTVEATNEVVKLQRAFGGNLEAANGANASLKLLGISTDDYIGYALRLDRQIRANNESLQRMGFTAKDLDLGQKGLIDKAVEKLLQYKEGVDRNIASQVLFGRNVQDIYPLLQTHLAGVSERAHELEESLGLTVTEGDKARAVNYQLAMRELGMALEGIKKAIGEAVLPYLTKFAEWFTSQAPALITNMKGVVASVVDFALDLAEGFMNFLVSVTEGVSKLVALWGLAKELLSPGSGAGAVDFAANIDAAAAKLSGIRDKVNATIEDLRIALKNPATPELALPDLPKGTLGAGNLTNDKNASAIGMAQMQNQIRLAQESYQQQAELINTNAKLFGISEAEKTQALITAVNDREQKQLSAANAELATLRAGTPQYQKVQDELTQIAQKGAMDRQKIADQELLHNRAEWQSSLNSIAGAFNSQLKGLLAGTTSWATAMKNIAADLVMKMIEKFEELAIIKPLLNSLANISPPAELFASILKAITASLGQVFAGVSAFFAPTLGPAAPAAAAGVTAGVQAAAMGFGKFEQGAWEIPGTMGAILHGGEMVLPAGPSQAVRDFFGGGGSGGGGGGAGMTFAPNFSGFIGTQAMINQIMPQLARALPRFQALNPSTVG